MRASARELLIRARKGLEVWLAAVGQILSVFDIDLLLYSHSSEQSCHLHTISNYCAKYEYPPSKAERSKCMQHEL